MPKETIARKLIFIAAFLLSGLLTFVLSIPLAGWIKSKSDLVGALPIQAVMALPALVAIFLVEERVICKLTGQNVFLTVHPVTIGFYAGYLVHFAL
jgi:hypothetical protein